MYIIMLILSVIIGAAGGPPAAVVLAFFWLLYGLCGVSNEVKQLRTEISELKARKK